MLDNGPAMAHSSPMDSPEPIPAPKRDQDRFTGANCSPEKRKAIVDGIKSGMPIALIAQETHSAPATVQVVRDQELTDWRKESSNGLKKLARSMVHHFNASDLNTIPWSVKPVMLGIVMDKISQLDGEPTAIVEHRHSIDVSGLKSQLQTLPEITVEAEVSQALVAQALPEPEPNYPTVSNPQPHETQ